MRLSESEMPDVTTTPPPASFLTTDADADADALAFARAHQRWLRLRAEPRAWSEPDRQRSLAIAFLDYHAAKLALSDRSGEAGGVGLR